MFVEERKSEREIALVLNQRGILSDLGRPWTRASIHQILTNEKYIGNNIFNRVSYKLKQRRVSINAKPGFEPTVYFRHCRSSPF